MTDCKCDGVRLAVLDVDGVVVPIRSSWGYVHEALGTVEQAELNYRLAIEGLIGYWEWMFLDTLAWVEARPGITRWELERILERVEPLPEAKTAVQILRDCGVEVALLSGGIDVFVSRIAAKLGIRYWAANMLAFDEKGRLVPGGYAVVEAARKDKVLRRLAARLGTPLRQVAFVGDSRWDVEAMKEACLAIAVRPDDEQVVRYADYTVDSLVEAARIICSCRR